MVKAPSKTTLRKYGLTEEMWYNFIRQSDFRCPICQREYSEKVRPVVDHEHRKGFKRMKPEQKRQCVRGILCLYCNLRRIPKGSDKLTPGQISAYITLYLTKYEFGLNK